MIDLEKLREMALVGQVDSGKVLELDSEIDTAMEASNEA